MKVSDYVVQFLEENRISEVFSLTGGSCMHLTDSFGRSHKMNIIYHHHEQAAAMAAEACSKFSNCPSVVLVTSGPAATNTITGLAGAFQDSVPCIFISGQSKVRQTVLNSGIDGLRQFGVQEVNIIPIVSSLAKYAVMISDKNSIRYHLEKSLFLAKNGRPGPVWLDIPLDIQSVDVVPADLPGFSAQAEGFVEHYAAKDEELSFVAEALAKAKRPVIIAGNGIKLSGAVRELLDLANACEMPVVTPILGIDTMASDDRHYIGRIGTKGTRAGNFALQNSDLILAIGTRLSISSTGHEYGLFAREAKVIVVDIDPIEHTKSTVAIDTFIHSDARFFIGSLTRLIGDKLSFAGWLATCGKWKAKYPVCLPEYRTQKGAIHYYAFVDELTKQLPAQVPVISDAGSAFYVVSQAIQVKPGGRYITSGGLATMGFGVPAAIGVCAAAGRNTVVSVTGDGSFQQNIQELAVIRENQLPVIIFVMNNKGYFSIRQTQQKFFQGRFCGESSQSGVWMPETEKIAAAYELTYRKFDCLEEFSAALPGMVASRKPMVVEIMLSESFEVIPTVASMIKPDGSMVSKPLEDMYPFLPREEFRANMLVQPVKE
jgi:acetolactate synthase I/II/III large subunit